MLIVQKRARMPRMLFFVTEDWFFVSHFLPMARAAREAGFDVAVATRVRQNGARLRAEGLRVIPLDAERGSLGLLESIRNLAKAVKIVRTERAEVVHCVALRSVVIGGIAAKLGNGGTVILAPTGLGHLWVEQGLATRILRGLVRWIVGSWLRGPSTHYLFENRDDPREFWLDPDGPEVTIVGGAGVDPAQFPLLPLPPAPPVKVAVVARMIWPKGIAEAVEAARHARALGAPIELHLFGGLDQSNRRPIGEAVLREWSAEPGITWHGATANAPRVWREHHVALFLSYYREGLPRTLVEAAATGRAIVTTNVTGCRDVVRDGIEGILVQPGDIDAAGRALARLAGDPALRARMGMAANRRFHEYFTEVAVQRIVGRLYHSLRAAGTP
jgi:glycosyltransferase involved in cell wall biosynthesis